VQGRDPPFGKCRVTPISAPNCSILASTINGPSAYFSSLFFVHNHTVGLQTVAVYDSNSEVLKPTKTRLNNELNGVMLVGGKFTIVDHVKSLQSDFHVGYALTGVRKSEPYLI